nr:hypothetical protein K-LCC10_0168 [Kaumoebavirus]
MDYDLFIMVGWSFTRNDAKKLVKQLRERDPVMICEMDEKRRVMGWLEYYFGEDFVSTIGEVQDNYKDFHVGVVCSKGHIDTFMESLKNAKEELTTEFAKYLDLLGDIEVICSI